MDILNSVACGLIALAMIVAVLHPRVHDGVIVKVGLISMALGFGSIALRLFDGVGDGDATHLARSILMISAGVGIVLVGYILRNMRHPARRLSDWLRPRSPGAGMVHLDPWSGRSRK